MKKITIVLLTLSMSTIFADSTTDKLYAAYQAKSRKKKEKVFQEGKKEIGSKKEQLKPLQELAEKKGDFAVFKQAVKDREKEKLSWISYYSKTAVAIGVCIGAGAATLLIRAIEHFGEDEF